MSDIGEVWKYWFLKHGFRSISKILQGHHFVVSGPKNLNF